MEKKEGKIINYYCYMRQMIVSCNGHEGLKWLLEILLPKQVEI